MRIHHVFCLAPHLERGGSVANLNYSSTEKMVQILSVAVWKSHYPKAHFKLYADSPGLAYLQRIGLHELYDSIDTNVLDAMPTLNHQIFWAGSKLFAYQDALQQVEHPIFIDTDAILWCPLENFKFEKKSVLVAAHYEPYHLKDWKRLFDEGNYDFATPFFRQAAFHLNCSFVHFRGDKAIWLDYCQNSIQYMLQNAQSTELPIWAKMCFAEQVMLLMEADDKGVMIETLGKISDSNFSQYFTHLWSKKALFRKDSSMDRAEAMICMNIIFNKYRRFWAMAKSQFSKHL